MYYVFIENGKINGKGQCPCSSDGLTCIEVSQEVYDNLGRYIWDGTELVDNPNYEQEQIAKQNEQIRQERQMRYESESDPIRLDYDEALARGEDTAEQLKQDWLASKDKIREELPYVEEQEES